MEFRLLGPIEVVDANGDVIDVRGEKQRALLTVLALRVGDVVTTSQLVESLWGEQDIRDPDNAVQVLISKLRRSLRAEGGEGGKQPIVTSPAGYRLDVDPLSVDVVRFERLAAEGRRLLAEGAADDAAELLRQALALWRGQPFADSGGDFCAGDRIRLEELRMATLEASFDADLGRGLHEELLPELEAAIAAQPLRERLRAQQMLALYRAGRQVEALRAFQAARDFLAEEVGIDPGPELRRLEAEILAQSPALAWQSTASSSARPGNLPAPISGFVGRVDELRELDELIGSSRFVTIVGTGGAGKTRLALEVAAQALPRFPNGCWLVELAALTDPSLVEGTALHALGLESAARLDDYGVKHRALVVVDNCEHLIESAARLVARLLRSGPGVVVLATSREGLGLTGEHRWLIPPLASGDARELFVDRARAGGAVPARDDLEVVSEICDQLDRLPLALELAAARTRTLALEDIAARIGDRFRLLTRGDRTAGPRQQTLRGVVDWSYDLLFAEEQRVFRRLSVFAGGFDIDAAERVVADATVPRHEVMDIVGRLVEKSLVFVASQRGASRYQLFATLSGYGHERLVEAGEETDTKHRHLTWMVEFAADARRGLQSGEQPRWAEAVLAERHNLQRAAEWAVSTGRGGEATVMAADVAYSWLVSGAVGDGRVLLDTVLGAHDEASADEYGRACAWAAYLTQFMTGATPPVVALAERAIALGRESSPKWFGQTAVMTSVVLDHSGRTDEAVALLEQAAGRLTREPDPWTQAYVDWAWSGLMLKLGQPDEADRFLCQSVEGFKMLGDCTGIAMASLRISELAEARGEYDEAFAAAQSSYEAALASGGRRSSTSFSATRLGNLAAVRGRYGEAGDWFDIALARAREGAYPEAAARALSGIGHAAYHQGELDEAEQRHREALAIYETSASPEVASELALLGLVAVERDEQDTATDLFGRGLREATRGGDRRTIALVLEGLACTRVRVGDGAGAAVSLGAAAAIRGEPGDAFPRMTPERLVQVEEAVRALIGAEAAAAGERSGRADPDKVVIELLAEMTARAD